MPKIIIPFLLRKDVDNKSEIELTGHSLGAAMNCLWEQYPDLKSTLDDSILMSIFVNDELINVAAEDWDTVPVGERDEITLIIPIAGG